MRPVADQTLEELDGLKYGEPSDNSFVVTETHRLRLVPIKLYKLADLRFMILQQEGLQWLVPSALAHLEKHPFAEGTYYRGDLLHGIIEVPADFWTNHPQYRPRVVKIIEEALKRVQKVEDVSDELENQLRTALPSFRG